MNDTSVYFLELSAAQANEHRAYTRTLEAVSEAVGAVRAIREATTQKEAWDAHKAAREALTDLYYAQGELIVARNLTKEAETGC